MFDITTTDVPFYDKLLRNKEGYEGKVKVKAELVYMTPDEYLNICCELQDDDMEGLYKMISKINLEELREYNKENKLPLPFLNMYRRSQEGRHRAVLAKENGITDFPVLIIEKM